MIKSCRRQQMSVGRYDHRRERSDQMWSCLCKAPHKQRRAAGTRQHCNSIPFCAPRYTSSISPIHTHPKNISKFNKH